MASSEHVEYANNFSSYYTSIASQMTCLWWFPHLIYVLVDLVHRNPLLCSFVQPRDVTSKYHAPTQKCPFCHNLYHCRLQPPRQHSPALSFDRCRSLIDMDLNKTSRSKKHDKFSPTIASAYKTVGVGRYDPHDWIVVSCILYYKILCSIMYPRSCKVQAECLTCLAHVY